MQASGRPASSCGLHGSAPYHPRLRRNDLEAMPVGNCSRKHLENRPSLLGCIVPCVVIPAKADQARLCVGSIFRDDPSSENMVKRARIPARPSRFKFAATATLSAVPSSRFIPGGPFRTSHSIQAFLSASRPGHARSHGRGGLFVVDQGCSRLVWSWCSTYRSAHAPTRSRPL